MNWASELASDNGASARITFAGGKDLMADLGARLSAGTGFSVATLNLDHAVKLRRNAAFRAAYRAQSHVTADGRPVIWLERLAGRRTELLPGADLVLPLAALAARLNVPVALVGADEAALTGASRVLRDNAPGLRIVQTTSPRMGFEPAGADGDAVIDALRDSGARLCFLALGAPRQELFAARARTALPEVGFVSVGAGLDFLAGTQKRAPRALRAVSLEWAWRLSRDPLRLAARYGACAALLPVLALEVIRADRPKRASRA